MEPTSLRAATVADRDFVVDLAARTFAHLGDYAKIMGGWFDHPEVAGVIAEREAPVGFALWAFLQYAADAPIAMDLVGLAVEPAVRRQGIGRGLLRRALRDSQRAARRMRVREASLIVDLANPAARGLFLAEGYQDCGAGFQYPAGQVGTRMARPLAPFEHRQRESA